MTVVAALVLLCWVILLLRGFWLFRDRDDRDVPPEPTAWPTVVAVVPARDEADVIARTIAGLLAQDYPGYFRVRLVDDASSDGTATVAQTAAAGDPQLTILTTPPCPPGWTGKLWALAHGVASTEAGAAEYLWLTDADIGHAPDTLRNLVTRAVGEGRVLVSTMARLHCSSFAERALIPAFVYFFAMLFPFGRVNAPGRTAAAAGGCVLVRTDALAAAGGIASIRGEIIDDCALARRLKREGPIWLGLSTRSVSLRPYGFDDIRRMVARSAYAQLGYSPLLLAGTVLGMLVLFVGPLVFGAFSDLAGLFGIASYLVMTGTMGPIVRYYLYRGGPWSDAFHQLSEFNARQYYCSALPVIAIFYVAFTLDSAIQHWRGRGGMWKGRAQALPGAAFSRKQESSVQSLHPAVAQRARHLPDAGEDAV